MLIDLFRTIAKTLDVFPGRTSLNSEELRNQPWKHSESILISSVDPSHVVSPKTALSLTGLCAISEKENIFGSFMNMKYET
jgi:hypothetical protein